MNILKVIIHLRYTYGNQAESIVIRGECRKPVSEFVTLTPEQRVRNIALDYNQQISDAIHAGRGLVIDINGKSKVLMPGVLNNMIVDVLLDKEP